MKGIKSISLIALITVAGHTLADDPMKVEELCEEAGVSVSPLTKKQSKLDEQLEAAIISRKLNNENTFKVCKFLEQHRGEIDEDNRGIKKSDGWTR